MTAPRKNRPRMRPTFEIDLHPVVGDAVLSTMGEALRAPGCPVQGIVLRRNAELTTAAEGQHLWSPHLTLQVSEQDPARHVLCGRFGPHAHVWTGFMAIYGVIAMVCMFGMMLGVSQWLAALTPWGLLIPPAGLALGAFTYGAAFIGQGLGSEEMYALRSFVDRCVAEARASAAG